jgi:hypothetical protein
VSYLTPLNFDSVLAFYQEQMPLNGWTQKDDSMVANDAALLYFEKPDREATITLSFTPLEEKTAVMIIIQVKE